MSPHRLQQEFFPVHYSGVNISFPLHGGNFTKVIFKEEENLKQNRIFGVQATAVWG